jgi:nitroreductase
MRFIRYAGWRSDLKDDDVRNFHLVKIYHALEKSMSFTVREPSSGWRTAHMLADALSAAQQTTNVGYHDRAALEVLSKFVSLPENRGTSDAKEIRESLGGLQVGTPEGHGRKVMSLADLRRGVLQSPEDFFGSRYSLREFRDADVAEEVVEQAVSLALKTPSVCNRQAWHVYHSSEQKIKAIALSYQSGNRGFGQNIPRLLIITSDLKAFMAGEERYQHWIDGGLFSMSLVYAFHSLGVGSCCLNWSQSPSKDRALRKRLNIRNNHSIIMMLAVGWPQSRNSVCASMRRPLRHFISALREA